MEEAYDQEEKRYLTNSGVEIRARATDIAYDALMTGKCPCVFSKVSNDGTYVVEKRCSARSKDNDSPCPYHWNLENPV